MSAFVVSEAHIDYLIEAGLTLPGHYGPLRWFAPGAGTYQQRVRELRPDNASEVGLMLWAENHRSVSYRYDEVQATPAYRFVHRYRPLRIDPVVVLKAVNCLDYQSCETPDWKQTEAYAFLESLKETAIRRLPGYDGGPGWSIEQPERQTATA